MTLPHLITIASNDLLFFARGGGGGSGGGGGGADSILFLMGYIPPHAWGVWLRRRLTDPALAIACLAGTLVAVTFWIFVAIIGFRGWGILLAALALAGGVGGYRGWGERYLKRIGKAKKDIAVAAQADPAWDLTSLQQGVQNTFMQFQADWSTFNIDSMRSYLTEPYWQHMSLVMAAIKLRQRRNDVQNPELISAPEPTEVQDFSDNSGDRVTFMVKARANDVLIEQIDGQETLLFQDKSIFTEYWRFVRSGSTWLIDGIMQETEDAYLARPEIESFAKDNGLFYSKDWGWLLLPRRGMLFSGGRFGKSDINNHVIGVYHNLIVELYTYLPSMYSQSISTNPQQYVIAQVALPKRYDSLIVQAKQGVMASMFQRTPAGYNKLSLEWADFNKRYNVYATNVEQVTAFELLHPVYMEKLFALPFKVNIEVVDNVVYLYSLDNNADYAVMYSLLRDSFEEMKL